ncbi:MAG: hypothetical protein J0H68_04730 [Sphingobacteriia bacterium]|nr:hypothetical protein [Sphingobacteriia bacterium]
MSDLIKELEDEIKQEKIYSFIINNASRFLLAIGVSLLLVALFLWFESREHRKNEMLGDKFIKAIDHIESNKIVEANLILDEIIEAKHKTLSDLALYYKNSHLNNFTNEVIEKLKNSKFQLIAELSSIHDANSDHTYEILKLKDLEIKALNDIAFNRIKEASAKLNELKNKEIIPNSIVHRVEAYNKVLEIKNYENSKKK